MGGVRTWTVLLIVLAATLPAFAGGLPLPPVPSPVSVGQCAPPPVSQCLYIGPHEVTGDETHENESVTSGTIMVRDGGNLTYVNSFLNFTVGTHDGIFADAGAHVRIINTPVQILDPTGTAIIHINASADAVIVDSSFVRTAIELRTNDTTFNGNTLSDIAGTALHIVDVNVTLDRNDFTNNGLAILVQGSDVTITDSEFRHDTNPATDPTGSGIGIDVYDSCPVTIKDNTFTDLQIGIRMTRACGLVQGNDMEDRQDPIHDAIVLLSTSNAGTTDVRDNSIANWGVGISYCDADFTESGNDFQGNGDDTQECP